MNWAQVVSTLIFVVGTFVSVLEAIHLSKYLSQKLPEYTTVKLEQFARMAVQHVEQTSKTLSGPSKKQLARTTVFKLFNIYKLPVPSVEALDIAIESAVFALPKSPKS